MQRRKVTKSVRPVSSRWVPGLRASPKPFGFGELHPNNFSEYQDQFPYAFQILSDGWAIAANPPRSVKDSGKSEKVPYFVIRWRMGTYQVKGSRAAELVSLIRATPSDFIS
jgi:hypothetical protein